MNKLIALAASLSAACVLAGCERVEEEENLSPSVTGAVVDGPVAGSRIFVTDCFNDPANQLSNESLSDDNGTFSITLQEGLVAGIYCANAVGGEYLNTSTGRIQVLDAGTRMTTPFYYYEGEDTEIAITPFTTLITSMIEADLGKEGVTISTAFTAAHTFVVNGLDGIDPIVTIPVTHSIYADTPQSSPDSAQSEEAAKYALYLSALEAYSTSLANEVDSHSNNADQASSPGYTSLDLISLLSDDYNDGGFDGITTANEHPIDIQPLGQQAFDASTVWLGMANNLRTLDFTNLGLNESVRDSIDTTAMASGLLSYSPVVFSNGSAFDRLTEQTAQLPGTIASVPEITSGEITIDTSLSNFPNAIRVDILFDANPVSPTNNESNQIVINTDDYTDGSHQMTYLVTYADDSVSSVYSNFTINNTTPFISSSELNTNLVDSNTLNLQFNDQAVTSVLLNDSVLSFTEGGEVTIPNALINATGENVIVIVDSLGEEYRYPLTINVDTSAPEVVFSYSTGEYHSGDGATSKLYLDKVSPDDGTLIISQPAQSISDLLTTQSFLDEIDIPYVHADWDEDNVSITVEVSVDGTGYDYLYTSTDSRQAHNITIPITQDTFGPGWLNYYDQGITRLELFIADLSGNTTSESIEFNAVVNADIIEIVSNVIGGQTNIYEYVNGNYALIGSCITSEAGICRVAISEHAPAPSSSSFIYVETISGTFVDPYSGEETDISSIEMSESNIPTENGPMRAILPRESAVYNPNDASETSSSVIIDSTSSLFTSLVLSNDDYAGTMASDSIAGSRLSIRSTELTNDAVGTESSMQAAAETFEETFGFNPITASTAELSDGGISSLSNDVERSLLNGSLSLLADNLRNEGPGTLPINTLSVTNQIAEDLSDGIINGLDGNGVITPPVSASFSQLESISSGLVSALLEFSNSSDNATNIPDQALFDYVQNVSASIQSNLGSGDTPSSTLNPIDYTQDLITLNFDMNSAIKGSSTILANISDVLEYNAITVDIDGTALSSTVQDGVLHVEFGNETQLLPSGAYELTISLDIQGNENPILVIKNIIIDNDDPEFRAEYSDAAFWSGANVSQDSLETLGTTPNSLIFSTLTNLRGLEKSVESVEEKSIPNISFFVSDNFGINRVHYQYTLNNTVYSNDLLYENQRYVLPIDLNYLVSEGFILPNATPSSLTVIVEDTAGNTNTITWKFDALSHTIIDSYETLDVALDGIDFYNRHLMDNRNRVATQYEFTNTSLSNFYIALEDNSSHTAFETFNTAIRENRAYIERAYRLRKRNLQSTDCDPEWSDWVNVNRLYNYEIGDFFFVNQWTPISAHTSSRSDDHHEVYADDGIFPAWQTFEPGVAFTSNNRTYDFVTDPEDLSTAGYWGCSGESYAQYQNAIVYRSIPGYPRNVTGIEALTFEFKTISISVFDKTTGEYLTAVDRLYEIQPGHSITVSKIVNLPDMHLYNDWDVGDMDTFESYVFHRLDAYLVWEIQRPINVELRVSRSGRAFNQVLGSGFTIYSIQRPEDLNAR